MTAAPNTSNKIVTHSGDRTSSARVRPTSPKSLSMTWRADVARSGEVPNVLISQVPRIKITTTPSRKQMIAAKRFRREPRAWNWGLARQMITRTTLMITSPAICSKRATVDDREDPAQLRKDDPPNDEDPPGGP